MKFEFNERVEKIVDGLAAELKELTLKIHDNPELGNEEFKACKWQMEILEKYGFQVEDGFCGIPTAYKAVYRGKKEGPKIAMLAEYDALPELGHGCGHNLIAMVGVGAGIAMREFADEYGAEIHVIGTPAEETAGAKVEMSKKGAFKGYDVAMMAHPMEEGGDTPAFNSLAIKSISVEFFGKPAHAAAAPEKGVNALDAMINFFNMVNALRQQTTPDARMHGIIRNGGTAANVIPEYTEALFYIRGNKVAYVEELYEKVKAIAEGAAMGTGCRASVNSAEVDFKDTDSNIYLANMFADAMVDFGHEMSREIYILPGSSDLGDVSYECPAIQATFSMGESVTGRDYVPHTPEFTAQAGSELAMNAALDFIKGFVVTGIKLMTEPEHLAAIKEEFEKVGK